MTNTVTKTIFKPSLLQRLAELSRGTTGFCLWGKNRQTIKQDRKRVFGYEVKDPGDLFPVDTLVRFEYGIKRYILTACDIVSRFSFAFTYKSHSSNSTSDFMEKLIQVTPYPIKAIQTDNGSEFLNRFDQTIAKHSIVRFFTYPRCPRQNGVIKKFNRTLQEEFVEDHRELLEEKEIKAFNNQLLDYLLFSNTQRPHRSPGNQEPMKIVVEYLKKSNMYWTNTTT